MRVVSLFDAVFWGIVLIAGGLLLIFGQTVFKGNIPYFRLFIAVVFFYLGMKIILGGVFSGGAPHERTHERTRERVERHENRTYSGGKKSYDILFSESSIDLDSLLLDTDVDEVQISVIFGSAKIRLNDAKSLTRPVRIKADAIFGAAEIYVPESVPIHFEGNAVFGETRGPKNRTAHFGRMESRYNEPERTNDPQLRIIADTVFGAVSAILK